MPTYEYRCHRCNHTFEIFQSITAEPVRICPVCHEAAVVRILTGGSGVIFKGSGFYITDYKKNHTSSDQTGSSEKTKEKKD